MQCRHIERPTQTTSEIAVGAPSPEFYSALSDCIPFMRAFARSLIRNRDRADDLVQGATIRALTSAEQFTCDASFKTRIFAILRRLYYDEFSKRCPGIGLRDQMSAATAAPALRRTERQRGDFRDAFWQLGEHHRETLMLILGSGLSYYEAAKICQCTVGTIKSREWLAGRKLTKLMSKSKYQASHFVTVGSFQGAG